MFDARVIKVLIASPGDTASARAVLREVLGEWNSVHGEPTRMMVLPVMWERDATPAMGDRAQAIINRQLVDNADVLIGVFWTRLGTPTGESESGTAEEIARFVAAGKPVLLYFSAEPVVPTSIDPTEYARLIAFRDDLRERGLVDSFSGEGDLWRKVSAALTRTMRENFGTLMNREPDAVTDPGAQPTAKLVARLETTREVSGFRRDGAPRYSSRHQLVVENVGDAAAKDLSFDVDRTDSEEGGVVRVLGSEIPASRLVPGGRLVYPVMITLGAPRRWDVVFTWRESGEARSERHTVA